MTQAQRQANVVESDRALRANIESLFGDALPEPDVSLALRWRLGLAREDTPGFLAVFERMLAGYLSRYPGAASSPDFHGTVARQLARVLVRARAWGAAFLGSGLPAPLRRYRVASASLSELGAWARLRLRGL